MNTPLLALGAFTVHFGSRLILDRISMDLPHSGVTVLMGPGGAGKSTLARTIAGLNDNNPHLRLSGTATLGGAPIADGNRPALVIQRPELMSVNIQRCLASNLPGRASMTPPEQHDAVCATLAAWPALAHLQDQLDTDVLSLTRSTRALLFVVRAALQAPSLLILDEPTSGLHGDAVAPLLDAIRRLGQERAVLFITHNQQHARATADRVLLLAGGRIQEDQPTDAFFANPQSQPARDWIRTGSCSVPSPDALPEHLEPSYDDLAADAAETDDAEASQTPQADADDSADPDAFDPLPLHSYSDARSLALARASDASISSTRRASVPSASRGPRGFRWVIPGRLGGSPQPGVVLDIHDDIRALQRIGADLLVTLTEDPLPEPPFHDSGISVFHVPIVDTMAPSLSTAAALCARVESNLKKGLTVIYHCKAGIGRTGTLLACQLIWQGVGADEALTRVRNVEPRYVQSEVQERFLVSFANAVHRARPDL